MVNLNRIFPWLSIRSKLLIAFAGLSILPLTFVGVYGILSNVRTMQEIALENLSHDVQTIKGKTANFLESIESDLRVVRHSAALERFIRKKEHFPRSEHAAEVQFISNELLAFAQTKGIYYQLRMVDESGDEMLRVECMNAADSAKAYRIVTTDELRHARESFYRLLTNGLARDQIAFAPAELVDQANERIPVISFAMPLIGMKQRHGILIANVFGKNLLQIMEGKRHLEIGGKVVLVAGDGHYLYHSEKKRDWNKLLASREEDNLQRDYPPNVAAAILSGNEGTLTEGIGEIISYAPLFAKRNASSGTETSSGLTVPVVVFESVSRDAIMGPVRSFAWAFAAFLLLFLGSAIGLGLLATQQFTRPIAELWRGAGVIAKGNYNHRLHVETHDEIEKLADQFNAMAASLEGHEKEIQQHRAKLEEMVAQRTHELVEEKTKLQVVLDNVPSAFVLVDKEFRIQTASATFAAVTGLRFEDVRGMDCRAVFCKDGFCQECVCRRAFLKGEIESHIDRTDDKKGGERFIEHIAIPVKEDGQITSIIEIITDVTKRKRFEEQLLRTERLMAVGEMSSIIAHEFRNSLTSVKMIMQLQKESQRLRRSDKKSIAVALDSIGQMEGIVAELLNFARPKPMEFRVERLNTIVNESLALAQPHINKYGIAATKVLDAKLPPFSIDASHLKEALVNILLNAAQAFESNGQRIHGGVIRIRTKKIRLANVLRDFSVAGDVESESSTSLQKEIVLGKGTECALIEIRDTGCGIEQSQLARIFDPFFTTKTNGTGLGLSLVKRTVNAHGGIVLVKSKKGRGTTFSIYLPLPNC
jgi:PAS domain S-box-containing protein